MSIDKKKLENFWYYYKWHTISAIVILLLSVFFIKDYLFKEKYDVTVTIAAQGTIFDDQQQNIKQNLEKYATDINGDGKVNVGLNIISFPYNLETADPQVMSALTTRLMAEFTLAESHIYIFDETIYKKVFASQSDLEGFAVNFAQTYGTKNGIDGYKYYIAKSALANGDYTHKLKDEWFIVMRGENNAIVQKNEKNKNYYNENKKIMQKLLEQSN